MPDSRELLAAAAAHADAERYAEARADLESLIAADPENAGALHMLARLEMLADDGAQGPEAAAGLIGRAIAADPENAKIHHTMGTVQKRLGNGEIAIAAFTRAAALEPGYAEAHFELGALAAAAGHDQDAAAYFVRAGECRADFFEAYQNLATALSRLGDHEAAVTAARAALRLSADHPVAYYTLAVALESAGETEEAIDNYRQAMALRRDYFHARNNLGRLLALSGDPAAAVEVLVAVAGHWPDRAAGHLNLGNALLESGAPERAAASLKAALALDSTLATARNSLAIADHIAGDTEAAIEGFRETIVSDPEFAEAHENLAHLLLQSGQFAEGWREFEWRWRNPANELFKRSFSEPLWDGAPLAGKTILLYAEQGLGDSIQFIRYAPLVAARGGRVIVECQAPLVRLFAAIDGVDGVVARGGTLPPFDCRAPLLSLPGIFATVVETIPAAIPYLGFAGKSALPAAAKKAATLKIGISWAGNPQYRFDPHRFRGCPPAAFGGLAANQDVTLVSFQKGPGAAGVTTIADSGKIIDLAAATADFADDAATLADIDLVITIDTALGHLAGALGRPCWIVLPMVADWRWLRDLDTSPWYPRHRLFRQSAPGDWQEVFARIAAALPGFIAARTRD